MRRAWTVSDSLELYGVANWGDGFFGVNAQGHVEVRPRRGAGPAIDLLDLVQDLKRRGLRTPLLVRFSDILATRVQGICQAFQTAIADYGYRGRIALTAHHAHDAEELEDLGADCVLLPFADAAKEAADRLLALRKGSRDDNVS